MQTKNVNQVIAESTSKNEAKNITNIEDKNIISVNNADKFQEMSGSTRIDRISMMALSPPEVPSRGVIPPPYRQPPPPPAGSPIAPGSPMPSPGRTNNNDMMLDNQLNDVSHVYKNVAELAMYADKFTPKHVPSHPGSVVSTPVGSAIASGDSEPRNGFDIPTIHNSSRLSRLQHNVAPAKPPPEKPAVSKKPGFIQQRLRSLLPQGLSDNKKSLQMDDNQPRNNDPLLAKKPDSFDGVDNPGHSNEAEIPMRTMQATSGPRGLPNGASNQYSEDLPSPSAYCKDWPKSPTMFLEDAQNSARLRNTCSKLFPRDHVQQQPSVSVQAPQSNVQTPASILAKNTTSCQEFDKVGQKEGVMKQLEQLESRNVHHNETYMLSGRKTPSAEITGRKTPVNESQTGAIAAEQPEQTGRKTPQVTNSEQQASNLLPEQTYTIEKRAARTQGNETVRDKKSPGSVSSGVYTMSGRNSDTTSTTSPEPEVKTSVDVANKQWNQVDCELRKIIGQNESSSRRKELPVPPDAPPATPPLPPVSPGNSPSPSPSNSPKLQPKSKYKLSLSATGLNKSTPGTADHDFYSSGKKHSSSSKKMDEIRQGAEVRPNRVRRTTTIAQANFKPSDAPKLSQNAKSSSSHRRSQPPEISNLHKNPWHVPTQPNRITVGTLDDGSNLDPAELTSTTTGLDMDSLLDGPDTYYSSEGGLCDDSVSSNSPVDSNDMFAIRKQLEGLETMYSEVLKLLGSKAKPGPSKLKHISDQLKASSSKRRVVYGSLSSLSVASRSNNNFLYDRSRNVNEKRRSKDSKGGVNKRFQRLESHVVTLARSVAHLSSEMRSQHMMYQEIENLRHDIAALRDDQQQFQQQFGPQYHRHSSSNASSPAPRSTGSGHVPVSGRSRLHPPHSTPSSSKHKRSNGTHKNERISLTNCSRVRKLTKFFGTEPPLLRQFLKSLGYEKYATGFETEGIGLTELPYLTDERFQKLGVPMGPRLRIMQEAQIAFTSNNTDVNVYIV